MGCHVNYDHKENHCKTHIQPTHFPCNCPSSQRQETQLKCCWELNQVGTEEAIFASPGLCRIVASGMINYECNSAAATGLLTVRFYRGGIGGALIAEYTIDEGSCLTFIASNFNTITVQSDHANAQGEICITPNYKLPCN